MRCPSCQVENPAHNRFCEQCGAPLEAGCPQCGAPVRAGMRFCGACGHRLTEAEAGAPATASQPQGASADPSRLAANTPTHLAEKILQSRSGLEGERKQVTVLFADLKGSMELLADRDPEEARQLLDPVLERMMEAVHRYEGTVNQVMGDGIMALFGAPIAHEDHAVRACYAALRMQEAVKRYATEVQRIQGVPLHIRVGLNSGEVVVRSIGSDLHMDYTAVGQTTHLAARMEQMAMPGTILITADTLRLVEGYAQVKPLGPIAVKGLADAVEVCELLGAVPIRTPLQALAVRGLTRFVGREDELDQLRQALEQARVGHGQVISVIGEPGVGKTRLFYEFTRSHRTHGWLILESRSVSWGKATPYQPVRDLLKAYCQIEDHDDGRKMREKVTGKLLSLDTALEPPLPAVLTLLDLPVEDLQWESLDPPQRRQHTLDAFKRLLLRESQVQPLLLVFENLHWIDTETQAILDSLVESLPTARLLFLVNYRPEYQHGWGSKTYYTQLRLDPLPRDSADELLQGLLGDETSLEPLKRFLIERTEGNPFFLEESVRALVETQVLLGDQGTYHLAKPIRSLQVPATVQAVLAARIDRLPPEEKRLLQIAAVIGTEVPFPLLQAILDLPEEAQRRGLAHLQAAEFLYETRFFPELEYTFKHALTHEVAYESLLHERRKVFHGRVVEAIERLYQDRLAEQVDRLAHHALRGEVWDKVLRYAHQAGRRAVDRSAYAQAGAYFDQALGALTHLPESRETIAQAIDLHGARYGIHVALGEPERLLACSEQVLSLAETLGDPHRLAQAATGMANTLWQAGDNVRALEFAQRGLALAEVVGDMVLLVNARLNLGQICRTKGDYCRGATMLVQTAELLQGELARERFGRPLYPAVVAREHLVKCLAELGEFRQAIATAEESLRIAEALQQPGSLLIAYRSICDPLLHQGRFHDALPRLERALALCTTDLTSWYPMTVAALGYAYAMTGRLADALPLLEQAVERARRVDRRRETQWLAYLSETYLRAGRQDDALTVADRVLALGRERHERGTEAWALRLLGEIAAQRHPLELAQAENHYQQAFALADELGMRPLIAHCHLGLGKLYRQMKRQEQARTELSAAIELYRGMEMTFWQNQAEAALM
jgi:class 3 adenylate cyclase/tetratricopeptide (TPR) repeat protein